MRVSSDKQVGGTSLDSQEKACIEYCKAHDISVKAIYKEKGESAKSVDRPEFLNAIDYCRAKKNRIDHFVVWKIDRFARNAADHAMIKAKLKNSGVTLLSVTEPIGGAEAVDELMETILAGFAQFDNDIRTQRACSGMSAKIEQGILPWHCPVGYVSAGCSRKGKKKNIPDEPHAEIFPILQKQLKAFSEGEMSKASLARRLTGESRGVFGKYFGTEKSVNKILQEKKLYFYSGYLWNPYH